MAVGRGHPPGRSPATAVPRRRRRSLRRDRRQVVTSDDYALRCPRRRCHFLCPAREPRDSHAARPKVTVRPSECYVDDRGTRAAGIEYEFNPGEGAFYGPKIDIKIKDALGRSWQCSTIQVDFNNPERFELSYIGEDGKSHQPIMIHRALMGSIERFFGILVEHYGGAFPTWLAPVQAVVMAITDNQREYVNTVVAQLKAAGFRADADLRNEKIGFKIREAEKAKVPYMLVAGDREVQSGTLSVRGRSGANLGNMTGAAVIDLLRNDVTRAQPELQPTH